MEYLKLSLQKYNSDNIIESDQSQQIVTLGYYDKLNITKCENWHNLRPVSTSKIGSTQLSNEYTIRVMRSEDDGDEIGDYDFWIGNTGKLALAEQTPFVACCLVNISDKFILDVFSGKDSTFDFKTYAEAIKQEIYSKYDKHGLKIAVYFGLGYTDVILLIRSETFSAINRFVNNIVGINKEFVNNEGEEVAYSVISSTYTVYGMLYGSNYNPLEICCTEKLHVSLDITLADKETNNYAMLSALKRKLEEACSSEMEFNCFSIYGSFDFRISLKNLTANEFYALYSDKGILSRRNKNLFKNINVKILFGLDSNKIEEIKAPSHIRDDSDILNEAFENFEKTFDKFFEKFKIHRRTKQALFQVVELYHKVTDTAHCLEVKKIVGKFFSDYLSTLCVVMNLMISNGSGQEAMPEIGSYLSYVESAIEEIRKTVSFLLFDIWRSDKVIIEEQSIAHPSIGSTAKLLFAYNNILNEWNQLVIKNGDTAKPKSDVSFLVTSGGCDETFAGNYFVRFDSLKKDRKHPWIITIPESSLYDVKGTLFRLAHEFFHIRGERRREFIEGYDDYRPSTYLKGLCYALAEYIVNSFDEAALNNYMEYLLPKNFCDVRDRAALIVYIIDAGKKFRSNREGIKEELRTHFKKIDEQELDVLVEISEKCVEILSYYRYCDGKCECTDTSCKKKKGCLFRIEGYLVEEIFNKLYEKCIKKAKRDFAGSSCRGDIVYYKCGEILKSVSDTMINNSYDEIVDTFTKYYFDAAVVIDNSVRKMLNIAQGVVGRDLLNWSPILFNSLKNENRKQIKSAVKGFFDGDYVESDGTLLNYSAIYRQFRALYKECFADCLAVKATNINTYFEYVFAFLYEHRSVDDYFAVREIDGNYSINIIFIYRFNLIRDICFKEDKFSEDEFIKKFAEFYPKLFLDQKFEEKFRNDLWKVLKFIEDRKESVLQNPTVKELKKYLEACVENNVNICVSIAETMNFDGSNAAEYMLNKWVNIYDKRQC